MADISPKKTIAFDVKKRRTRFLGLSLDEMIRVFFGGNAIVSVIVLGLITLFLCKEGSGFFGQNRENLQIYRQAGLEYVDYMRHQVDDHTALSRTLSDVRVKQFRYLTDIKGLSVADTNKALTKFDDFSYTFGDAIFDLRNIVSDLTEEASTIKTQFIVAGDHREQRKQLFAAGKNEEADEVEVNTVDFQSALRPILNSLPAYENANATLVTQMNAALQMAPEMPTPALREQMEIFRKHVQTYEAGFPETLRQMKSWDYHKPVEFLEAFTAFFFGRDWLTASFWQDWYGVIPLFTGSLLISLVALIIAMPLGVGAAVYVNQLAHPSESKFIKPCIEFIAAFPSVVLGFFGIAVLGQALRLLSQQEWMAWLPGFPFTERLNVLTAGCLLALIAVPTIFTLAEDAINNVPRAFKEASFALGATKLQTIIKIIVPASLSGIISAVLLGFGRVIGETMVVLLCAGNRIKIPDFTAGLGVVTQPVHTMTGIIAQEMGEVVRGGIHYRALFVVGMTLFFLALLINYLAQKIVHRYRISIG